MDINADDPWSAPPDAHIAIASGTVRIEFAHCLVGYVPAFFSRPRIVILSVRGSEHLETVSYDMTEKPHLLIVRVMPNSCQSRSSCVFSRLQALHFIRFGQPSPTPHSSRC